MKQVKSFIVATVVIGGSILLSANVINHTSSPIPTKPIHSMKKTSYSTQARSNDHISVKIRDIKRGTSPQIPVQSKKTISKKQKQNLFTNDIAALKPSHIKPPKGKVISKKVH